MEQRDRFRPGEELSAALAEQIPGFGGLYLDEGGNLHAHLLDMKNEGVARAALARIVAETRRELSANEKARFAAQPRIVLHHGEYEFTQLADWRNRLTDPILQVAGVVYNGLDEHANRLAVGVDRTRAAAVRPLVEKKLAELAIPRGAVNIEDTDLVVVPIQCEATDPSCQPVNFCTFDDPSCEPADPCTQDPASCEPADPCTQDPASCETPTEDPCVTDPSLCTEPGTISPEAPEYSYYVAPPNQTLASKFSRLFGGVRIRNYGKDAGGCTLGFVATYRGTPVFATNSHCTPSRAYRDYSSYFYQPSWNNGWGSVGEEIVDNGKMAWGRYVSDVALARIVNISGYLGYMARTRNPRSGTYARADTTVDSSNPYLKIISEVAPRKDYEFHKIGATTGWTFGYARKVCYDTSLMRCVSWVAAGADEGDSGSPVFRYYGSQVGLAGLVYAKADGGFWMTPMSQIRIELNATGTAAGDLRTY
jgi:hypothetical protein